jgi:hypothetical protein
MHGRHTILVGKLGWKRRFGRPKFRWEDNTKMDLKWDVKVWDKFNWLRIGSSGGIF